jgi:hypothetical protein
MCGFADQEYPSAVVHPILDTIAHDVFHALSSWHHVE